MSGSPADEDYATLSGYDTDAAFWARMRHLYLTNRPTFFAKVVSFAVERGCDRYESAAFAKAVARRVQADCAQESGR